MMAAFQLPEPLPDELQGIVNSSVVRFEKNLRSKMGMWAAVAGDKLNQWIAEYRIETEETARAAYEVGQKVQRAQTIIMPDPQGRTKASGYTGL